MSGRQKRKLDQAARAAWLYYIAGNTQDEIAAKLDVSRQAAQRLVALAVQEKLIEFRLDHPLAGCLDLAARLKAHFGLDLVEVVPDDPASDDPLPGIPVAAGARDRFDGAAFGHPLLERGLLEPQSHDLAGGHP